MEWHLSSINILHNTCTLFTEWHSFFIEVLCNADHLGVPGIKDLITTICGLWFYFPWFWSQSYKSGCNVRRFFFSSRPSEGFQSTAVHAGLLINLCFPLWPLTDHSVIVLMPSPKKSAACKLGICGVSVMTSVLGGMGCYFKPQHNCGGFLCCRHWWQILLEAQTLILGKN